ncbi:Uncharacterized protein Rs2_47236 [Raphanus sativus]|nr:Uncharacterized protein Rs2_47236 [Raphanus sativus]
MKISYTSESKFSEASGAVGARGVVGGSCRRESGESSREWGEHGVLGVLWGLRWCYRGVAGLEDKEQESSTSAMHTAWWVAVVTGLPRRRKIGTPVGEARRREARVGDGVVMATKKRTDPVSLLTGLNGSGSYPRSKMRNGYAVPSRRKDDDDTASRMSW